MRKVRVLPMVAIIIGVLAACLSPFAQAQSLPGANATVQLLSEGREPVRVVCFGDSITGVYYHSGSRRAWSEMLQIALKRLYPQADVTVFNAGKSGHTSAMGLARIQKDVLDRQPHLVVVMFGMNDLAYGAVAPDKDAALKAAFVGRLKKIVKKCRDAGAEVILCTQNPVYPDAVPRRPPHRLGEFAELVCRMGKDLHVSVTDIYSEWEKLRKADPRAWRLLMSETIHPSMSGHKRIAEQVAETISGRAVSLDDILTQQPVCGRLVNCLKKGKPVTLMAPETLTDNVRAMVLRRFPAAEVTMVVLPDKSTSLEAQVEEYKSVRSRKPDLVFVSLASEWLVYHDEEAFIRQFSWVVNRALPFAGSHWSVVGVDPALVYSKLTGPQQEGAVLVREIVLGHDLDWIGLPLGRSVTLQDALDQWFAGQVEK